MEALKAGLKEDIMDVIATDHAPHSEEEKNKSMKEAMFGIVGLETMASLTYTELVDTGVLPSASVSDNRQVPVLYRLSMLRFQVRRFQTAHSSWRYFYLQMYAVHDR